MIVTVLGAVLIAAVLLVARYGADSRTGSDPTGRDPAWPAGPTRAHTPRGDAALLGAWARRVAAHRRCWELFERSLRPWSPVGDRCSPRHRQLHSPALRHR